MKSLREVQLCIGSASGASGVEVHWGDAGRSQYCAVMPTAAADTSKLNDARSDMLASDQ